MNKYYYEGKTKEQAEELALEELKVSKEDLIINSAEEKNNLLKKSVKIEVLNMNEIVAFIKDTINEIIKKMHAEANLEVRRRENSISITIFSDNNALLIGKNGKNISALQLLIRQMVNSNLKEPLSIVIDVGNYKEKRARNIELTMYSMNYYERRIVHSALADDKYVYTESIGEEPNRKVVIKLKGE